MIILLLQCITVITGASSSSFLRLSAPAGLIDFGESEVAEIVHALVRMRMMNPYNIVVCTPLL